MVNLHYNKCCRRLNGQCCSIISFRWNLYIFCHLNSLSCVKHTGISKRPIIGSDDDLSPGRRQAIIRTNAGILLIRAFGTNFSEILSKIHTFSFKEMHFKMSSAKWRPFCLGLNVLTMYTHVLSLPNTIPASTNTALPVFSFSSCFRFHHASDDKFRRLFFFMCVLFIT